MSSDITQEIDLRHLLNYKAYASAEDGIGHDVRLGSTVFNAARMALPFVARVDLEKLSGNFIRGRVAAVTGSIVFGASAILYKPQYVPTYLTFYDLSQDV